MCIGVAYTRGRGVLDSTTIATVSALLHYLCAQAPARSLPMVTLAELVWAAPTWEAQVTLALLHAVLWAVVVNVALPPFIRGTIRRLVRKRQYLALNRETFRKVLGWDMGDDEEHVLREVALMLAVVVQHGFGGLLCAPSVLGLGEWLPPRCAGALARHGGLCEVGWEIGDSMLRAHQMARGGAGGRARNPPGLLLMLLLHHSAAQCLVLPLNVHYGDNVHYHEGVLLLQLAAFVALLCQQYGFTLDVTVRLGLRRMRLAIALSFAALVWSRVLRYGYVWYALLSTFYADESWGVLGLACTPLGLMSLFNVAMVRDATEKLLKFSRMHIPSPPKEIGRAGADTVVSPPASRRGWKDSEPSGGQIH